jgi:hypothetical protein
MGRWGICAPALPEVLTKNKRTTAEWTTFGGKFYTKKQGTVKFKLPELFLNKTVEFKVHVD